MRRLILSVFAAVVMLAAGNAFADEGWFGLDVEADGEGRFWNPTVRSIKVAAIETGSPAAASVIAAGDRLLAIDGIEVAGKRVRKLAPHFEKAVGQTMRLTMARASGEQYEVELTGAQKPAVPP